MPQANPRTTSLCGLSTVHLAEIVLAHQKMNNNPYHHKRDWIKSQQIFFGIYIHTASLIHKRVKHASQNTLPRALVFPYSAREKTCGRPKSHRTIQ
jgi:hypothetical protein